MIWMLFKNCGGGGKKKDEPPAKRWTRDGARDVLRELLAGLQERADGVPDGWDGLVHVTDAHFASASAVLPCCCDPPEEDDDVIAVAAADDSAGLDGARRVKFTESRLASLQCPFNWTGRWTGLVDRVEREHGRYRCANVRPAAVGFSFEKYVSNTVIGCGLFKMNKADEAHEKLTNVWNWLDSLDETHEPSYVAIRDGLKHVVMSSLCHGLYAVNKPQCRQLFEMITQFDRLNAKSRAAVFAVRSAVCAEIAGGSAAAAVEYAEKACDLDPDNAQWNYVRSVALTVRRRRLDTCKSRPAEAEFDAVQRAIVLANEPNPYFEFHRMFLMANQVLYHCRQRNVVENPSERVEQDFRRVVTLIKAIVSMEPEDPHLIVKCAKSLMALPYFHRDNVQLVVQTVSIAVNMACNDPTVVRALQESIEAYKQSIGDYKEMIEKKTHLESTNVLENEQDDIEDGLDNDFKCIVNDYKKGGNPILGLVGLLDKYDGNNKWKIMAQICSYSILNKTSGNLLVGFEQFMMLIRDEEIARSEIVTCHRSVFVSDESIAINLAELVCNEIKLAITNGHIKNPDQTQLCLDYLTKIMEVCRIKSKKLDPNLKFELLKRDEKERPNEVPPRRNGAKNENSRKTKHGATQSAEKNHISKQNTNSNNCNNRRKRVYYNSKTRRKNHRIVLKNVHSDGQ